MDRNIAQAHPWPTRSTPTPTSSGWPGRLRRRLPALRARRGARRSGSTRSTPSSCCASTRAVWRSSATRCSTVPWPCGSPSATTAPATRTSTCSSTPCSSWAPPWSTTSAVAGLTGGSAVRPRRCGRWRAPGCAPRAAGTSPGHVGGHGALGHIEGTRDLAVGRARRRGGSRWPDHPRRVGRLRRPPGTAGSADRPQPTRRRRRHAPTTSGVRARSRPCHPCESPTRTRRPSLITNGWATGASRQLGLVAAGEGTAALRDAAREDDPAHLTPLAPQPLVVEHRPLRSSSRSIQCRCMFQWLIVSVAASSRQTVRRPPRTVESHVNRGSRRVDERVPLGEELPPRSPRRPFPRRHRRTTSSCANRRTGPQVRPMLPSGTDRRLAQAVGGVQPVRAAHARARSSAASNHGSLATA